MCFLSAHTPRVVSVATPLASTFSCYTRNARARLLLLDSDELLRARVQRIPLLPGRQVDPHAQHRPSVPSIPQPHHGPVTDRVRHTSKLYGVLEDHNRILNHKLLLPVIVAVREHKTFVFGRRGVRHKQ